MCTFSALDGPAEREAWPDRKSCECWSKIGSQLEALKLKLESGHASRESVVQLWNVTLWLGARKFDGRVFYIHSMYGQRLKQKRCHQYRCVSGPDLSMTAVFPTGAS